MILNNFKKVLYLTSQGGNTGCTREEPVSPVSISGGTSSSNLMYMSSDFCSYMKYLPSDLNTSNNGENSKMQMDRKIFPFSGIHFISQIHQYNIFIHSNIQNILFTMQF